MRAMLLLLFLGVSLRCLDAALSSARTADCAQHGAECWDAGMHRRSPLRAMLLSFGFTIWGFGRRAFLGPNYRLRPARRVTFANRGKSNQNRLPLHPAPALPGSPRSGAVPGARHEGPSMALAALAASLPLDPFHDTCARPAEGANWCGLMVLVWQSQKRSRKAESAALRSRTRDIRRVHSRSNAPASHRRRPRRIVRFAPESALRL